MGRRGRVVSCRRCILGRLSLVYASCRVFGRVGRSSGVIIDGGGNLGRLRGRCLGVGSLGSLGRGGIARWRWDCRNSRSIGAG